MSNSQNEALNYFAKLIEKELGIIYSESNHFQLQNRLEEITKSLKLGSVTELLLAAQRGMSVEVKDLLLDTATNNETSFFRDTKLFQSVQARLLPESVARPRKDPFRVWSAACSTGQEPYTLAIILQEMREQAELRGSKLEYNITASDISSRALARAKKAHYSQLEIERGLAAGFLSKYFDKVGDQWAVRPVLTNNVNFQRMNLLDSFSRLGKFDLIFCRNVLIYQDVQNKSLVIDKLASCLNPGGHLVLGAGESMIGLSERFEVKNIGEAIVYEIKAEAMAKAA